MMERAVKRRGKFVAAGLALVAVLIGAECVRAAVGHHETTGSVVEAPSPADLVAAELDPAFVEKLAYRFRGPYERSHQMTVQARY